METITKPDNITPTDTLADVKVGECFFREEYKVPWIKLDQRRYSSHSVGGEMTSETTYLCADLSTGGCYHLPLETQVRPVEVEAIEVHAKEGPS